MDGVVCSECEQTGPKRTYLMRCEKCDYDLRSDCFGPRKDSIMKFLMELQDKSDEGAEADDEDAGDDCELDETLLGEMPEEEIGEGVSKAAKENRALTEKFKGLKMSERKQELFMELVDIHKEEEDFETFLDSPLVESISRKI